MRLRQETYGNLRDPIHTTCPSQPGGPQGAGGYRGNIGIGIGIGVGVGIGIGIGVGDWYRYW